MWFATAASALTLRRTRRSTSSSSVLAAALSAPFRSARFGRACVASSSTATRCGTSLSTTSSVSSRALSSSSAGDDEASRIVDQLRGDPALFQKVASSVDYKTAARWALIFSKAAGASKASASEGSSASADKAVQRPEASQLSRLMIRTAVPFVGFGFFDNVIMLTVGETIDCTLGVAFGFSTLAAAGMGQMVSDASGITLQGLIERFADRLGLPDPHLTLAQQQMTFVKYWMIGSRIIGIVLGCALGMCPLVFMPERQPRLVDQIAEKLSSDKRAEFQSLVSTKVYYGGEKLLPYGECSSKVFMIQEGTVEVVGRDLDGIPFRVCSIGPGHSFGIPELSRPSHVDLVAKDDKVTVQVIEKADFLRITDDDKEGIEVFKEARSMEHQVYLRSQGKTIAGKQLRAEKGTGKTRMFASMSQESKLKVLSYLPPEHPHTFEGVEGEGKVRFFGNLPEVVKRDALFHWVEWKELQEAAASGAESSGSGGCSEDRAKSREAP